MRRGVIGAGLIRRLAAETTPSVIMQTAIRRPWPSTSASRQARQRPSRGGTTLCLCLCLFVGSSGAASGPRAEDPGPLPSIDAITPLPPVEHGFFDRIRLAALGDPQDLTEPLLPDDVAPPGQPRQEFEPPAGRKLPPGAKPGPLQQAIFTVTELPRFGTDGLGLTTLDASLTIGMPAPTVESPLLVTPGFGATFVDEVPGPTDPGLPGQLYDSWIQARWMRKIGTAFGVDLAVAPGWYSDFVNDTPQAFRITGHGFVHGRRRRISASWPA